MREKVVPRTQPGRAQRRCPTRRLARLCGTAGLLLIALPAAAIWAQSIEPDSGSGSAPLAPLVTVHGLVKDAVSGQPLARVLVTVDSRFGAGALTDGDGRFEISGVPAGSTAIQLEKPGFEDASDPQRSMMLTSSRGAPHSITAAADMPDLEFAMRPLNAIRGQIQLSTGDPAEKFRLELLAESIVDGREVWRTIAVALSNADGAYRFGGLSDGLYAVETQPSLDGEVDGIPSALNRTTPMVRNGYARTFYPDAREFSGSARIRLSGGQTIQANLSVKQEPFHLIRATVSGPGLDSVGHDTVLSVNGTSMTVARSGFDSQVLDTRGHALPYRAEFDSKSHMVQALLPDGDYILRVSAFGPSKPFVNSSGGIVSHVGNLMSGQTDVSVDGHAVTNLRIALGPENSSSLEVIVNHTNTQAPQPSDSGNGGGGIFISASQAVESGSEMNSMFAQGAVPGSLDTQPLAPGSYWLHTTVAQPGLCEASFTAGGANLGHEPLVVGLNGSSAPLTLTLRDDCASLKLSVPPAMTASAAGEGGERYVCVVPDFDSTTETRPVRLSASALNSYTLDGLTPGAYHVYVFSKTTDLPYRDPQAMAALNLQGQAVTLSPGATSSLVLEAPAQ